MTPVGAGYARRESGLRGRCPGVRLGVFQGLGPLANETDVRGEVWGSGFQEVSMTNKERKRVVLDTMRCVSLVWVWGHLPAPVMMTVIVAMGLPPSPRCPTSSIFHSVLPACWHGCIVSKPWPGHLGHAILLCPSHALIHHSTCSAHADANPPAPKKMALLSLTEQTQMRSSGWSSHLSNTRGPSAETECGQNAELGPESPTPVYTCL